MIDRTNHHLFKPLLHLMATGIVGAGDFAPPITITEKQGFARTRNLELGPGRIWR